MKQASFTNLSQVNAFRARNGLEPVSVVPNVMRPGKTAKKKANRKNRLTSSAK